MAIHQPSLQPFKPTPCQETPIPTPSPTPTPTPTPFGWVSHPREVLSGRGYPYLDSLDWPAQSRTGAFSTEGMDSKAHYEYTASQAAYKSPRLDRIEGNGEVHGPWDPYANAYIDQPKPEKD